VVTLTKSSKNGPMQVSVLANVAYSHIQQGSVVKSAWGKLWPSQSPRSIEFLLNWLDFACKSEQC